MGNCSSPLCLNDSIEENGFCEDHQFIMEGNERDDRDAMGDIFTLDRD